MDRTERLFNLVLALTSTAHPLPRETLRGIIDGYTESASDPAFERMFERDKDELRSLGIPVETVTTAEGEVLGYVIPRDDYRLPPIRLTGAQWSLLGVAARAWSQAAATDPARSAIRKLEAAGDMPGAPPGPEVVSWQVRPEDGEQWLPALWAAIRRRREVHFDYLGLRDEAPARRSVQPWSVIGRGGGWYLVGFDIDRGAPRAFRLSRISGTVTASTPSPAFDIPVHDADAILQGTDPGTPVPQARVAVAAGAGERLRLTAQDEPDRQRTEVAAVPDNFDLLLITDRDISSLAAEIAALGDQAIAVEPTELISMVATLLDGVRRAHLGPDDGAGEGAGDGAGDGEGPPG